MSPHQLHPLEVNPKTNELFLRVHNHPTIILTPMRWSDALAMVPIFNDPRVYSGLRTPLPYQLKDAEAVIQKRKPIQDAVVEELLSYISDDDDDDDEPLRLVNGCPIGTLRELNAPSASEPDTYIGTIWLARHYHGEVLGPDIIDTPDYEGAERRMKENEARELGDPEIVWTIADFLSPSHQNRGIMTSAIHTLIHAWAVPRMGVRFIEVGAFVGNPASVRVFEKIGFKLRGTIKELEEVRGEMKGLHILEWRAEDRHGESGEDREIGKALEVK